MNPSEFKSTLGLDICPEEFDPLIKALWYLAKDDWHAAHDIVSTIHTSEASWIHAHLHRIEGDKWNAGYWYERAGRPYPNISFSEESTDILKELLKP